MIQMQPDREAFERVCKQLEFEELNCKHLIDIFGWPVVELFLLMGPEVTVNVLELIKKKIDIVDMNI